MNALVKMHFERLEKILYISKGESELQMDNKHLDMLVRISQIEGERPVHMNEGSYCDQKKLLLDDERNKTTSNGTLFCRNREHPESDDASTCPISHNPSDTDRSQCLVKRNVDARANGLSFIKRDGNSKLGKIRIESSGGGVCVDLFFILFQYIKFLELLCCPLYVFLLSAITDTDKQNGRPVIGYEILPAAGIEPGHLHSIHLSSSIC